MPSAPEAWDDGTLAARCAAREEAAWREFLRRAGPVAQGVMRRFFLRAGVPDPDREAAEALGDLAAALLRNDAALLKAYRPSSPLRVYAAVIARGVASRILRKRPRRTVSLESPALHELLESGETAAPGPEDLARLERALGRIPAKDRLLLRLLYWDALPYAEIAPLAGVAPGSLGPLLTRAREALRKEMALPKT